MNEIIGIPDKTNFQIIPTMEFSTWKMNVQEHDADRAGLHYDLRLNPPNSEHAYS